ncbi:cytochrome P450 [Streptomyces sp. NPDC048337]|uniref:cytochrome P450 n=1 Tax=Streptomyces sp. NPDC048337 TaxID=3365535 RepID=UPI00371BE81C
MRTVQGVALDGLRARVRALAERTRLPMRPAAGAPAARYRWAASGSGVVGRAPRGEVPVADRGPAVPALGAGGPGWLTSVRESFLRTAALLRAPRPRSGPARSSAALRALRARHGDAPVLLRSRSGERILVLLDPRDLCRFYAEPVSPQPRIDTEAMAAGVLAAVAEEARHLTASGTLELARAHRAVGRAARRIVLGEAAAGDEQLAGWLRRAHLDGPTPGLRKGTPYDLAGSRIREYAGRADASSLVARAGAPDPAGRARQWLLAMDSLPATLLRTLLLLGAHPAEQEAAAAEAGARAAGCGELPRLRACVRESLRLYPVVPELIRVTRAETDWRGVRCPAGTSVLLPAAFHQRDPERVPAAHVFVPGRWKNPAADHDTRMAPFGHGGGRCPGDELGLLVTAAFCAEVLRGHRIGATRPVLDPVGPLPATLDAHAIRLGLTHR